jgi:hypothetical protein
MFMKPVTFCLSTGRSGTQWLAAALEKFYPDVTSATHEPVGVLYHPRRFLRTRGVMHEMPQIPGVREHIVRIQKLALEKPYIETGWPCFAAVPFLAQVFGKNLRLIHIVRHPVKAALSMQTHGYYQGGEDTRSQLAQLTPFDPGILQSNYARSWEKMTPYEKCLFHWTEINLYAEELFRAYPEVPQLRILSEDLFSPECSGLKKLLEFLSLPLRSEICAFARTRVDRFRMKTSLNVDWEAVFRHPETVALAGRLGYRFDELDTRALRSRYAETVLGRLKRVCRERRRAARALIKAKFSAQAPKLALTPGLGQDQQ